MSINRSSVGKVVPVTTPWVLTHKSVVDSAKSLSHLHIE